MESLNKTVVRAIMPVHNEDYGYPFQDIDPKFVRLSGIVLSA